MRLLVSLVESAAARDADPASRGDYAQNRWAAARHGLDATLIHPDGDRTATARELAAELLGADPPEPEALRQLEVAAAQGQAAVAADLVGADGSLTAMATQTETLQVTGIRCERCVGRLAGALEGHDGLEYANANLMGQVTLSWDDERTSREELLAAMSRAGFRELAVGV